MKYIKENCFLYENDNTEACVICTISFFLLDPFPYPLLNYFCFYYYLLAKKFYLNLVCTFSLICLLSDYTWRNDGTFYIVSTAKK